MKPVIIVTGASFLTFTICVGVYFGIYDNFQDLPYRSGVCYSPTTTKAFTAKSTGYGSDGYLGTAFYGMPFRFSGDSTFHSGIGCFGGTTGSYRTSAGAYDFITSDDSHNGKKIAGSYYPYVPRKQSKDSNITYPPSWVCGYIPDGSEKWANIRYGDLPSEMDFITSPCKVLAAKDVSFQMGSSNYVLVVSGADYLQVESTDHCQTTLAFLIIGGVSFFISLCCMVMVVANDS